MRVVVKNVKSYTYKTLQFVSRTVEGRGKKSLAGSARSPHDFFDTTKRNSMRIKAAARTVPAERVLVVARHEFAEIFVRARAFPVSFPRTAERRTSRKPYRNEIDTFALFGSACRMQLGLGV